MVLGLGSIALLFKLEGLLLELVILLVELIELLVGIGDSLLSGLHFLDEVDVIFFGLKQNVVKLGVRGLELPGLLFKLLEGID